MQITYGNLYRSSEKNIKRRFKEQDTLNKIKNHIKQSSNFIELKSNPISIMYGFEQLKYELNDYYSFNLCKNGGKIRLIFSIDISLNQVSLEYISVEHYADFKNKLKRI